MEPILVASPLLCSVSTNTKEASLNVYTSGLAIMREVANGLPIIHYSIVLALDLVTSIMIVKPVVFFIDG